MIFVGMSISQVADKFGVEPHTLRFYEKEGIVAPSRTQSGIRTYDDADIGQLEMAMCLKSTGMPLKDIKKYFELVDDGNTTLDERLKVFTDHREFVLSEIDKLEANLRKIERKISWYSEYIKTEKAKAS